MRTILQPAARDGQHGVVPGIWQPLATSGQNRKLKPFETDMSTVIIKRFVGIHGCIYHSIRRRSDGNYQIYRDGAYLRDGSQPYWMQDEPISGLFADVDAAEEEVQRSRMQFRALT